MVSKIVPTGELPNKKRKEAKLEIEGFDGRSTFSPPIKGEVQDLVLYTLIGRGIVDPSDFIKYHRRSDYFKIVSWRGRILKIRLNGMG